MAVDPTITNRQLFDCANHRGPTREHLRGLEGGSTATTLFRLSLLLLLLLSGKALGTTLDIALVALQLLVGHLLEGVRRVHRLEEAHVVTLVAVYDACRSKQGGE